MIDVDAVLTAELERLVPMSGDPDWESIARAAGLRRKHRLLPLALVAAVAVVSIGFATPLGADIGHGLGGFHTWLTGEPGKPAPNGEQASFAAANAHSFLGFPKDTQLRELTTERVDGDTVNLSGFRTASSFCLRLSVVSTRHWSRTSCAPLADLRRRDAPVRVLFADQGVGTGAKSAWYGVDRFTAPKLQVTAGIVDDSVDAVVLHDDAGSHTVPAVSDAFLYVAADPDLGQRVRTVSAQTAKGLVSVPYTPAPFGAMFPSFAGGGGPSVAVAAPARNGRVHWLEQHEPRGEPLSVLPEKTRWWLLGFRGGGSATRILYGRVLTPAAGVPARVVLTLNAHRHGGPPAGICVETIEPGAGGGGCAPYPQVFAKTPLTVITSENGQDQFVEVSGAAADSVARIRAKLANGQWTNVPLENNVFVGQLPTAHLPARLVAYDARGRIIGVTDPVGGRRAGPGFSPARGKATQLAAVKGPNGAHSELLVGRATNGGTCLYVKTYVDVHAAGVMISCHGTAWQGPAVQLQAGNPPLFVSGRVRNDVATVRLVYSDGTTETLHPIAGGYVLAVVAPASRRKTLVRIEGLGANGSVVGTERMS